MLSVLSGPCRLQELQVKAEARVGYSSGSCEEALTRQGGLHWGWEPRIDHQRLLLQSSVRHGRNHPKKRKKERHRVGERLGEHKHPGASRSVLAGRAGGDATQAPAPNAPGGAVLFSSRADTFARALKIYILN